MLFVLKGLEKWKRARGPGEAILAFAWSPFRANSGWGNNPGLSFSWPLRAAYSALN
jgi:hypothetical protein